MFDRIARSAGWIVRSVARCLSCGYAAIILSSSGGYVFSVFQDLPEGRRVIPRPAKRAEGPPSPRFRYASNGGCQSGVAAFPLRKPATAAAMDHPSTPD